MSSLHQSRGRVLFEAACAFAFAASLAGAWQQTYSSALLAAAAVAGLYGLVRFVDLFRREPAAETVAIAEPTVERWVEPVTAPDVEPAEPVSFASLDEVLVEVKAKPSRKPTKAKAGRRKPEPTPEIVQAEIVPEPVLPVVEVVPEPMELVAEVEPEPVEPVAELESDVVEPEPVVVPIVGLEPTPEPVAEPAEDAQHEIDQAPAQIAPLFEADPFRNRRAAFGRKAG